ncbi:MAG: HAMP domain-containing histidine kinase [Candidatus Gastranaerophilales bacterium]|nr:HAMP domain-containing histidine kinase [Candidatus Gastranaerophilales bacterium]
MRKTSFKRFGLAFLEHLTAGVILLAVAMILFHSHISVEYMNEEFHTYTFDPLNPETLFEDSQVFYDIFYRSVSDVTKLVVFKEEFEQEGVFAPDKKIDVTQYAAGIDEKNVCDTTAVYELDDLINWGKAGVDYNSRVFSLSDFVNYFGSVTGPEYFALDEYGELYFIGLSGEEKRVDESDEEQMDAMEEPEDAAGEGDETEEPDSFEEVYSRHTEEQLEDIVYSYIMSNVRTKEIRASHEDDGSLVVYVPMLISRYDTIGGEQLSECADNWVEYMMLQNNLAFTVERLAANYGQYVNGVALYQNANSNIKYAVRVPEEDGSFNIYTNVDGLWDYEDSSLANYFSEFYKYFVYYPDSLEFTGNSGLTEDDIYNLMNGEYSYAYPENTHIWVGVDTSYEVEGDAFYNAHLVFERVLSNSKGTILLIAFLALVWLGIGMYLTLASGVEYDEEGERICHLSLIDHIWTEVMAAAAVAAFYLGLWGRDMLIGVAQSVYHSNPALLGMSLDRLYEYGMFGAYGFLMSFVFGNMWFSLMRRIRSGNLWSESFCRWLILGIGKATNFLFYHRNTAISILASYNLFLLVNLFGMFLGGVLWKDEGWARALIILGVVIFDGIVGVMLFRYGAGQKDIIDGIKRIRAGEVDYKLELDTLSGLNKEMADAVNNIGEGIRKAVSTSMRDEQMKSDLITNVSHDIKTPLTSIVNYVDLLRRLDIQDEPAKGYIDVLDSKAQRLKQLTDDLVEASKISSGNIVLNMEKLNLTELLNQTIGEFSERLEERGLQVVFEESAMPAWICGDSRRMWRIVENLFFNICKYALEGTRVYLEMAIKEGLIAVSIKNISERQMNMRGDELTERFIRGDSSRTTEGSGLGLFIAKSLTQAQGGSFEIQLDGDLFKVVLTFPEYVEDAGSVEI